MVEAIGSWLVTVAGSAMLFGLFDMLLPSGSVRSFTRAVMGLVVMAIMLSPLTEWRGAAINWPAEVQGWFEGGLGRGVTSHVDWGEAAAIQDAGQRVAMREARRQWELALTRRLIQLEGVIDVSVTSSWGDVGPSRVGARIWLMPSSPGVPAGGPLIVERPAPITLSGQGATGGDSPPAGVEGSRAPPQLGSLPSAKGDANGRRAGGDGRGPGGSDEISERAHHIIQTQSGLSDERIHVEIAEEE